MRTDVPVVVLKLRPYPLHAGTIGMARSLGRLGVAVHIVGEATTSPIIRSRYVKSVVRLPDVAAAELAHWLVGAAPADRALLVAVDDQAAVFLQQQASVLSRAYDYPHLPEGLVRQLVDKGYLTALARQAQVPSPDHAAPATAQELDDFLRNTAFPVVVKMRDPDRFQQTQGVQGVEIAEDAQQTRSLWRRHLVDGKPNCILQEYIPGGPETIWMINGYVDGESRLQFAATGRKLRQFPPYTGATSLGVCQRNDEVLDLTARLVRSIGYRGILDIGWRFDARDGLYKLLDFNPRIGATFRLFVGQGGLDVVRACYLDLTGQDAAGDTVRDGRKWINDSYDAYSAVKYVSDGKQSGSQLLRSFSGIEEAAWWARDDVRPVVAMLRTASRMALTAGKKRARVIRAGASAARQQEVVRAQAG